VTAPGDPHLPEFVREALVDETAPNGAERELYEALGAQLPLAVPPLPASQSARERLLAAVARPPVRYWPFLGRLTGLLDLPAEDVERVLAAIDRTESWSAGPIPGVELMHFEGGPSTAGADVGLVRMAPRLAFPRHRHTGPERVFVLGGGYYDESGKLYRPGDFHEMDAGSRHSYQVTDEGLLLAVVLHGPIEIEGLSAL
jgi:quercetin dioxygenase-like cupin family protein